MISSSDMEEKRSNAIREYLSELIEAKHKEGMGIQDMADLVGVDRTTIYRWRKKEVRPDQQGLTAIFALGGSWMELGRRIGDPNLQRAVIFDYLSKNPEAADLLTKLLMSDPSAAKQLEVFIKVFLETHPVSE